MATLIKNIIILFRGINRTVNIGYCSANGKGKESLASIIEQRKFPYEGPYKFDGHPGKNSLSLLMRILINMTWAMTKNMVGPDLAYSFCLLIFRWEGFNFQTPDLL